MLGAKLSDVKKGMMTGIAALAVSLTSGCASNPENVYERPQGQYQVHGESRYIVDVDEGSNTVTTVVIPQSHPQVYPQMQHRYPTPRQGVQWGYFPYPKQGIVPMGSTTQPNLPGNVRAVE